MKKLCALLSLAFATLSLDACGSDSAQPDGSQSAASAARFLLRELAGAGPTGQARLSLEQRALQDGGVLLRIHASEAQALKGVFYEVEYDHELYSPRNAQALTGLGPANELLTLCDMQAAGRIQQGIMLRQAGDKPGLSGSALLAELRFERRPFAPLRSASKAPRSQRSRAALSLDEAGLALSWGYANEGDYDQNSEVNVADLAPLGFNFLQTTNGNGPFPAGSKFFMIDGDQNGELNIADLSPIGTHIQRLCDSYNVYRSLDPADVPVGEAPSTIAPLGFVDLSQAVSAQPGLQKRFTFNLPDAQSGWVYWVRPVERAGGTGLEGIPSNTVEFGADPGNANPIASFTAAPQNGNPPLEVSFDASASSDSDGSIVEFAWDFDGDGTVDASSASPTQVFVYQASGNFQARLTVTDDDGATDSISRAIDVGVPPNNIAPVASFTADPLSGELPLTVNFDASASSDTDGNVVNFTWDFDGDGTADSSSASPATSFLYVAPGSFDASLTVTDDGGATGSTSITITVEDVGALLPPTAALQFTSPAGDAPQTVTLDASASTDSNGTIVQFEWDFDGDGIFDAVTAQPQADHEYTEPGVFSPSVQVTDNDALTDTASGALRIRGMVVTEFPFALDFGRALSMVEIADRPAISWVELQGVTPQVRYVRALTANGLGPSEWPQPLDLSSNFSPFFLNCMIEVAGQPVLLGANTDTGYLRANANAGMSLSDWPANALRLEPLAGAGARVLAGAVVDGRPAILQANTIGVSSDTDTLFYWIANSSTGSQLSDWPAPLQIQATPFDGNANGSVYITGDLTVLDGRPSILTHIRLDGQPQRLRLFRSSTASGSSLPDWSTSFDLGPDNRTGTPTLLNINGRAAIICADPLNQGLLMHRSSTAGGGSSGDWASAFQFGTNDPGLPGTLVCAGAVTEGRPVAFFNEVFADTPLLLPSATPDGASALDWPLTNLRVTGGKSVASQGTPRLAVAEISGRTAIAWLDNTNKKVVYAVVF